MVARRSVRKRVAEAIVINNAMSGETLGRVGNLSVDGMMLISPKDIPEEHLYQVQFQLRDADQRVHRLEVGIQCLWAEAARTEHTFWAGCKIVDISPAEQQILDAWVERAAETV
jgi:hypothetical protein